MPFSVPQIGEKIDKSSIYNRYIILFPFIKERKNILFPKRLFISPILSESVEVLGTLLHELIHATVGCEHGHKKPFSQAARRVGLAGPPTSTTVGPTLKPILEAYVLQAGHYPHAAIMPGRKVAAAVSQSGDSDGARRPGSRLRLYECECDPPIKVRVASDSFQGQCLLCNTAFQRRSH